MNKRLKQLNVVLVMVLLLGNPLSGLSAGLPRTVSAYDPPPATTVAPSSPSSASTAAKPTPAPGTLSSEAEQARVQQAMDAAVEKYLLYWGPRYQAAPVEATVAGDWAHGVAEWKSQERILKEPLNLLAYRSSDGTWQVALPDNDEVFLQWVEAAPEHLVSAPTKDRLRAQAVEAVAVRPPKAMPMVPSPVIDESQSQETDALAGIRVQPTPTPTPAPPVTILEHNDAVQPTGTFTPPVPVQFMPMYSWSNYVDELWGYSLNYPSEWHKEIAFSNQADRPPYVIRQRLYFYSSTDAEITVDVWQKEASQNLLDWIDNYQLELLTFGNIVLPTTSNATVGGREALVVSQSGDCMSPQLFYVYIDAWDRLLLIQYTARDQGAALNIFKEMLKSLVISEPTEGNINQGLDHVVFELPSLELVYAPLASCEFAPNQDGCCGYPQIPHWQCSRDSDTKVHKGNCVYWAAYKRPDIGSAVGSGNADQWAIKAQNAGCSVDTTPSVGDIMVAENINHVAYVTAVSGGTVTVSEMNWCTTCPDRVNSYSTSGKKFIHSCGSTSDTTPPDGDYTSPSNGATITSRTVHMAAWATDNASGVRWVRFNAMWNGEWRTVFEDSSSPYEFDWDLCNSGVPDGDVEISLHIQDNSNNNFYLSDKHPNPHITKNYNCSPPPPSCNPTADQVALYVDANYSGNCVVKNIGQYSNPSAIGLPNDSISSIKVGGNVRAILCRDDNYGGVCETFYGDDPDLSNNSIGNDQVSSAKVEQRASLPAAPTLLSPENYETFNEGQVIYLYWSATGNEYEGEVWGGPGGTLTFGPQVGEWYVLGSQWAGYAYSWHIKAWNSAGPSPWSDTKIFIVRPATPTDLTAQVMSCSQINLTWADNSGSEEGYRIYRDDVEVGQVGADITSYQDNNLSGDSSYTYYVRAYKGSIVSYPSSSVVASTPSCVTPPSAPTLQSPSDGSTFDENQSLTLCWSATGNEYDGEIWGGPAGTLPFGPQGETCTTIGTQWAGYTYSWHVKAYNSAGESGWSSTWTFTVRPNAPSELVAQAVACDQINLSWADNSGNEEGYKVYRNGVYIGEVGADVTSYWDTGITENASYSYYVKAFRGSIESAASDTAYASTPVCPPSDTELPVVNWTLPVGNEQTYVVENETVQLQVEATDNVGVARVRFFRWDAVNLQTIEIGDDYTAPYQVNIDCSTLNYNWNETKAVAYDAVGNTSETRYIWLFRLTPAPDLEPYTLPGYPYPVVPSSITGTHEVNPLYAGQPTYFDWYFANSGTAVATDTFYTELWVDATRYVNYPYSDFGAGWVGGFDDWAEVVPTAGWHIVTLRVDPDDTINESDEDNNLWQEYFYWSPSAPFSDSMESGLNGWTATGLWHQVDDSSTYLPSHSPTHSWWYGQDDTGYYDTGAANSGDLTSPLIYIPTSGYFLRFNYAYATETQGPDWDQRWIQISVDGGPFDNVLQLYDDLMYRWLQSPAIDLSGYAGHAIQVRFHFDTLDEYYNAYLGWYIDDVDISTTPPPTCYDACEPNNTYAQATTLTYGDSPYADICPNGDYDFYRFTGTTGDKVVVDIDASVNGSALDPYIYLLDSDGSTVLTLSDDDYVSLDSHLGYELPHDGDYYIKVKAWSHPTVGSPNHFYVLNLLTDDTDPIAEMEAPLNGNYLSAITPITVTATDDHGVQHVEFVYHDGDWVNSEWQWLGADWDGSDGWSLDWDTSVITDQSDVAIYIWAFDWVGHWDGAASWNLMLDRTPPDTAVDITQPYGDAPFRDFWVNWWNSQDNLSGIASYDVQYRDGTGGVWTDLLLNTTEVYTRFVGTDNHTYYFRVRARDFAGSQSNYTEGDGDAQHTVDICDVTPDAYEIDDDTANATELLFTNGYTQTHNIHSESNPDWIKFYAVAGFTYTLRTTDIGGHADTVLYLYDTDGNTLIDYNDDYWELGFSSRIDWQPSVTGMYYASVIHWDPWAYGCTTAYGLSIASNDTTAPMGSILINDGQTYATSSVVTLTLNASDAGTGLAYVLLANTSDFSGGSLMRYAPTLTWTLASGDGNKTVYAQFYDWAGNDSIIYNDAIIYYEPVIANFVANPTRGSAPLNVAFSDQSTGSVATWEWGFGDGESSTLQNPVHTYSVPGVYTVSLTVRLPGAAAALSGGTSTLVRTGYITIADTYYIYLPLVVRNHSNALMSQENLSPDLGPLPRPY